MDGWFHTGDVGQLDADGNLTLTDRKKDLMKTSGGKYVAPQKVEGVLVAAIPFITQAVAVGDGRKYISALLTLDPDNRQALGDGQRHGRGGLRRGGPVRQAARGHSSFLDTANAKRLERWETVKKFTLLKEEFSIDDGDVTPSMKMRRQSSRRGTPTRSTRCTTPSPRHE